MTPMAIERTVTARDPPVKRGLELC
jgi:hypothetical protein